MERFVHLHLHSEYSLLDGACRIAEIPKRAKELGQEAVAITDHGVMYGVVAFYRACIAEGIKPIIGCEVYMAMRSRFDKDHDTDGEKNHLVLLVENETGYRNLLRMVSLANTEGFYGKPRVDWELLSQYHEGLIALSACLSGIVSRAILAGNYTDASQYARKLRDIFGENHFFLELQNHGLPEQESVNRSLVRISRETGIPLVATNDVHYLCREDAEAQKILVCIQTNRTADEGSPIGFTTDEFYMKSTEEMENLFSTYPQACENTAKIADMCNFSFTFGKTQLPRYPLENGIAPAEYLSDLAEKGLADRIAKRHIVYSTDRPEQMYRDRITYELSVIEKMGYCEYYLIVWDFVRYAKSQKIPVGPGRGSGAGSLVAFLLGITDIDPLQFDLLFERFLNPERVSMPDFDIDFCYNRRDEVIAYVREKYGAERTSQIITFGTMAARAVVRDVGRAIGMSYADTDAVASLIPRTLGIELKDVLGQDKLKALCETDEKVSRLLKIALKLEGMPRHASTHAAGVVITDRPLSEYVPVAVNNGITVTQYDMNTVADLGLLKFDFLALRYLTVIDGAEKQIRERIPDFDLARLPLDDKKTYDLISAGRTEGVFQLESGGMRQMLTQMKPSRIEDIIAAIALYRPGPMDSIPKYIEGSRDPSKIRYTTPLLAPILSVTNGCIVYQEQVMQIFRAVAGYSFGRADIVRRAIAKKKKEVLEKERTAFLAGAKEHGVDETAATELFEEIIGFANYAFNKSHAAAYSVLSFRTAYLKTHFPMEYYSALMTSVLGSDKLNDYISECKQNGICILPPHVNRSQRDFHVESTEGKNVRFGLLALKNIGKQFADSIIAEREKNGEYTSFGDFIERTVPYTLNKRQLEVLIKSGALDGFGANRRQMLAVYEKVLDGKTAVHRNADENQLDLFSVAGGISADSVNAVHFPEAEEFSVQELLRLEKECAGIPFSGHILDAYAEVLSHMKTDEIREIKSSFTAEDEETDTPQKYRTGQSVTLAGIVTAQQTKKIKNSEMMAFLTLEDNGGEMEIVAFPKVLQNYADLLTVENCVIVRGTISCREDEPPKLLLSKVQKLPDSTENPFVQSQQEQQTAKEETEIPEKEEKASVNTPVNDEVKSDIVTAPQKLYLRVEKLTAKKFIRATAFLQLFKGTVPVVVYDLSEKKYFNAEHLWAADTPFVRAELSEILGAENVLFK